MPSQFDNPANFEVHVRTTAQEILADFADDPIDVLITGVGTGGHLTGCAEVLKKPLADHEGLCGRAEPSPVICGGQPGPHPIQGIGAGFIPDNLHTEASMARSRSMPRPPRKWRGVARSGGRSAGRHFERRHAGGDRQKLPELDAGTRMLGFNYDTGERYLSVPDFLPTE